MGSSGLSDRRHVGRQDPPWHVGSAQNGEGEAASGPTCVTIRTGTTNRRKR